VKSLDHAGAVAESVKRRLADYFDTATGGADQTGWAVGANPIEEDVALALLDTPHLESIEDIDFFEVTGDGNFESWPSSLKANEIALLADDPIVVHFEPTEAIA